MYQQPLTPFPPKSDDKGAKEEEVKNSPEVQLSIINDETQNPDKIKIVFFKKLLASLQKRYPNITKRDIANALVASYNILVNAGESDSLLEFTTAFNAYSKEVDRKFNLSIEEALALFIRISYHI